MRGALKPTGPGGWSTPPRNRVALFSAAILAAMIVFAGGSPARAEAPSVMVVFDGSGSMWAKFPSTGQSPRFVAAREALKIGLADLASNVGVGLVTFGNRPQGSCSDIQTNALPERGDSTRILGPLEKLNPRGKGPLVQAVRDAATALRSATGQRHVILIHDDPDNCNQDPCQAATAIAAADSALKVHVISIAMRADDPGRPVCLARATGGLSFLAEQPADLAKAIGDIFTAIGAGKPVPPAAVGTPGPRASGVAPVGPPVDEAKPTSEVTVPTRPRRELESGGPPRLLLGARLAAGSPLLDAPLRWRVTRSDGALVPGGDVVGAVPEIELKPGRYAVSAEGGVVKVSGDVDVKATGPTEYVAELNAGLVTVSASAKRGGPPSTSAALTLRRPGADGSVLWLGAGTAPALIVPAGELVAVAQDGGARREQQVMVEAGKAVDVALPLEAGRLQLATVLREGGAPATDVVYTIMEDDPQAPLGFREIARSSAAAPDIVLPAGSYVVAARVGAAEIRERVTVTPGEEVARVIAVNAGRVRVNPRVQGPPTVAATPVTFLFRPVGAAAEPVATGRTDRQSTVWLAAGRYRLELRVGEQNAGSAGEIDVRSGSDVVVTQAVPVGRVKLGLDDPAVVLRYPDLAWEVAAPDGTVVWRTMQPEPQLLLAPGRYRVTVMARSQRKSKDVEVTAGDVQVVMGLE